jgi:hypothetical protein
MSNFSRYESHRHENDAGPPGLGEGSSYPDPHGRPSSVVLTAVKVVAVALAVGAVPAVVLLGHGSGAVRPVAQGVRATPPPRVRPGLISAPTPSVWPALAPSAFPSLAPSPAPPAQRKPIAHRARPARPVAVAPVTRRPTPAVPQPPVKKRAKPPVKAPHPPEQVSGYVQCTSLPVEGVWIVARRGGSGWAEWTGVTATLARYNYTLPKGGSYAVHVGCGGSLPDWQTTPDSGFVSGAFNDFLCHDVAGQADFDVCVHD